MGSITRLWDKYKKRFFYSDAHLKMRLIATVANVFLPLALSAPQFRTDTDPICAASVSAYTNAFKAGSDVKTANLIAAKAFTLWLVKSPPWHMKLGITLWKVDPLYPYPFSPVHRERKFSAVFGTTSLLNSMTIRPRG